MQSQHNIIQETNVFSEILGDFIWIQWNFGNVWFHEEPQYRPLVIQ